MNDCIRADNSRVNMIEELKKYILGFLWGFVKTIIVDQNDH